MVSAPINSNSHTRVGRFAGRRIAAVALSLFLLLAVSESLFARGGFRGGGFRFSGGYRSLGGFRASRGASGSFFRWGRTSRSASAGSYSRSRLPRNTATAIGGNRASVASERSLYTSARQRGTVFSSRQEAAQAFRSRFANQYTSRFATRPVSRPSYIPRSTTVGGRTVNIVYNQQRGGYGYIDPTLGHWVFFNALANAATLNLLMANRAYWWGPPPVYYYGGGPSFFTFAIILFFIFMGVSLLLRFFRQFRRGDW